MVSVCMAVKNGAIYIKDQIESILCQLSSQDELVVSDDHSLDDTLDIVKSFGDHRIKIVSSSKHGLLANFELALSHSSGDIIFLADQDDIWHPDKLETMLPHFSQYDVVVCDCTLVGTQLNVIAGSFFELNRSGKGFIKNLFSNSYMGCCMAFQRRILARALPFPVDVGVHDFWIGMIAEAHYTSLFLDRQLVNHRIHAANATTTGKRSRTPGIKRATQRYRMVRNLISRSL